jgi:hypothetical protein
MIGVVIHAVMASRPLDDLQWIVQKRRKDSGRGEWKSIIFCRTRDSLIANLGYEVV